MNIKTVWAVWFSATGTTQKVAAALAHTMGAGLNAPVKEYSFNLPQARERELNFGAEDLVVVGVPVYAGRVPNLLLPYIRDHIHGGGALAVPVVLYGNRDFDDGLIELRNVLAANAFHPISAGAFVGEHAFSKILGAGRPDDEDMELADKLALQTAELVKGMQAPPAQPVEVEGNTPIRPYYTPRDRYGEPIRDFLQAKPVTDGEKCVRCGLCASICPMGSIDRDDVSQVTGKCIKCCACVKRCPTGAKGFDHEGYLYHQHELEDQYAGRRAESVIFL
jgi:ferredoxin